MRRSIDNDERTAKVNSRFRPKTFLSLRDINSPGELYLKPRGISEAFRRSTRSHDHEPENPTNLRPAQSILGGIALTLIFLPALLHGFDAGPPKSPGKFVVHEWGTFTNFSGSDGVNLEFRPLATNDLPRFIMTPFNQPGSLDQSLA